MMNRFFKNDISIIILLVILFFSVLPFFFLHQGLLLIDTGREFYIPSQINQGGVLYKNICNIYGPFSYLFNALLFLVFGEHFNTLYYAGIINSLLIVICLYLLSREFLPVKLAFGVSLLCMFSLVFTTFLYNSNITYSFAIVYALSSFLLSLLFLIKYLKNGKEANAYFACLFAGLSIFNKYEFILYPFVLIYCFCVVKILNFKSILKALLCFFAFGFLCFLILFLQGLNTEDINKTIKIFNSLINAPSLNVFYSKFGIFFNKNFCSDLIKINGFFSVFGLLPLINLGLTIINFKKIYQNKILFVFILCSFIACMKFFFFLNVNHMGAFVFPICALTFVILLFQYHRKYTVLFLLASILTFAAEDFSSLKYKNFSLSTSKGNIYTYKKDGQIVKYVSDFILNNTNKTDTVCIFPEGAFINFITDRKSDNFYYSLIPLYYLDVFGENKIISHFKENQPEYIIILPIDNIEYGKSFFGIDYAQNFYEMIVNNYNLTEEKNNIKIFKRKNL